MPEHRAGGAIRMLTIALVNLLLFVALAEVGFRLYDRFNPSFVFYKDSYNRYRGAPGAPDWDFRLNSQGFKDLAFEPKRDGVYRILGLGDSFAFGVVPYADNYLTRLEAMLQAQGLEVEIYNMGIPGAGPGDYLALLVREGLALEPDMVLVSVFIGNDFSDSRRRGLHEYSYLVSFLRYLNAVNQDYEGRVVHGPTDYCDDCPNFTTERFLQLEAKRSFVFRHGDPKFERRFDDTMHHLEKLQSLCAREGIELLVALIPDEMQVDPALLERVAETHFDGLPAAAWDLQQPNRRLAEAFERLSIAYLDLLPALSEPDRPPLYRPRDSHWNIAGNRRAAEALLPWVAAYAEPY